MTSKQDARRAKRALRDNRRAWDIAEAWQDGRVYVMANLARREMRLVVPTQPDEEQPTYAQVPDRMVGPIQEALRAMDLSFCWMGACLEMDLSSEDYWRAAVPLAVAAGQQGITPEELEEGLGVGGTGRLAVRL